jgi:hypothetical protein
MGEKSAHLFDRTSIPRTFPHCNALRRFIPPVNGVGFRAKVSVSGLLRSTTAAETLMRHFVAPVLGALEQPERYREAAARADVVVHAAIDYAADAAARDEQAVRALLGALVEAPQLRGFLYTSGAWVYGDTGPGVADETHPLRPPRAVAWRPAAERARRLLGWRPRHAGFAAEATAYYASWQASAH